MDFRFTEQQEMMAETVRALLADLCQPADLRRLMRAGAPRDTARWAAIVEMGLAGALVPEDSGGLGLAPVDFVLIAQACGHAALPEPLVENAGVALPLLAAVADDARAAPVLARALAGEITVALKHPANPFVADADTAGALLVLDDDRLHLVAPEAAAPLRQQSADPFRRLFSLGRPPAPDTALTAGRGLRAAADAAFERGALFAAAQLLGIAQRAVDLAVGYAGERTQFGRPIGANQAVKHLLSTAQVKIAFARPVVHAAAARLDPSDVVSRARVSHAKLAAADAADLACRTAVQVHGAMGYSWEVDVHFFLKRALALAGWWGDAHVHRARVAERVFGHPLGAEHTFADAAAMAGTGAAGSGRP
ncbi:acyl-CoA/acyl-ACP dehydrogenase [Aquibium sp. A9E412]|uniref:acyl-CoA dehydrogenase family protein n=1 Tax=Aquibium sp. A9E412 TaxID=2976767 RepID=UPI0025AFF64F|nr:acyl-CoA dehydrogenase family protein [Aquibium sp. A9E412]MDN2568200.1 acyl-CoA/acyl-ACP dehydrogenase [Aquibium sp. A9E412]